jgi:erythrin-vacuolar iron transport family protein
MDGQALGIIPFEFFLILTILKKHTYLGEREGAMMKKITTIEEALDLAIEKEKDAYNMYHDMAEKAESGHARDILLGFAAEEATHQRRLEAVKNKSMTLDLDENQKISFSDTSGDLVKYSLDMNLKEALLFAMQFEKKAIVFYMELARSCKDEELKKMFRILAQEEAEHDRRFEAIYKEMTAPKVDAVSKSGDDSIQWFAEK